MNTALVTGGAGFLGSHLCDFLLGQGHRVVCVDNLDTGSLQNIEHIRTEDFLFVNHDLTEPFRFEEPVDLVFHLASPASPIDYLRLPLHTLKVGSYGTHHMLGLAKLKRARFLLASTSEVYGDPQIHPQPETYWGNVNPIGPRGVYDEAKRYAEALTMAYHRQQGVDTCIVRIFNSILADEQVLFDDGRELRREKISEVASRLAPFAVGSGKPRARRERLFGSGRVSARWRHRPCLPSWWAGRLRPGDVPDRASSNWSVLRGEDPVRALDPSHRRPLDLRGGQRRRA